MKTIVPVMGEDINQISLVLDKLIGKDIDIIELRVDYLKYITKDSINNSIEKIRLAGFKTIILTLRSIKDGGRYDQKIYTKLIDFFLDFEIDYIDIEIDNIEKNEAYALEIGRAHV